MSNWRYKIHIKHLFKDETTPELVAEICASLVYQLKHIKERVENSTDIDGDAFFICDELEMNTDNFDFLRKMATQEIPEDKWDDYSFNGDFEEEFNGYLNQLYDLGDERIRLKNGLIEKFIWIG